MRLLRTVLGTVLVLAALGLALGKLWLDAGGPYIESLPLYPYCAEAEAALADGRHLDAIELAEAGGCERVLAAANAEWNSIGAVFSRCVGGVWTGRAEDGVGLGCAVASDLVVFGDVRDLTRQGIAWFRGEDTDEVLVALSTAGIALTLTPQLGAGTSLLKAARRAGTLADGLARAIVRLVRERAWRPLAGFLTDAGRISVKVGPAKATRALQYIDDPADLSTVARFVEDAPNPLLGLKWGGKSAARLGDDALYVEALRRGPDGVQLAIERGGRALLARQPLIITAAKTVYRSPEAVAAAIAAIVAFVVRWMDWPVTLAVAAVLLLFGLLNLKRRRRPRGRWARPAASLRR
ncbi:MAG TPA: hypothetical protein VF164_03055 [Trueperaceae bacterium]